MTSAGTACGEHHGSAAGFSWLLMAAIASHGPKLWLEFRAFYRQRNRQRPLASGTLNCLVPSK
jgi:hypothetical protein